MFQQSERNPVRIAVLDTGFASKDSATASFSAKVIKSFNCIVNDTSSDANEYTHGTNVLFQLAKVCPNAKLFSYRIARRVDGNLQADKTAVLKALDLAITKHKVDIINMSFGWDFHDDDVEEKLNSAQKAGILLFASVANFGLLGYTNILYPASSSYVVAVDAADGLGEPATTNTSTETGDIKERFTAPGVCVQGYNEIRVDGTSFASPIAAGIAALVIEFAQQTPLEGDRVGFYLRKTEGMVRIFRKFSEQKTPAKFKFLKPWLLLEDRWGERDGGDGSPGSRRYHVATIIADELRAKYGDDKGIGRTLRNDTQDLV